MTPLRLLCLLGFALVVTFLWTHSAEASVYCNTGNCGLNITPIGGGTATDTSVRSLVIKIINFILNIVLIIAVLAVIIAGVYLITSGGDEGQKDKAKSIILYAAIGIVVILLSRVLVTWISSIF